MVQKIVEISSSSKLKTFIKTGPLVRHKSFSLNVIFYNFHVLDELDRILVGRNLLKTCYLKERTN